jgi:O-antigen/teichoic acid export membrane protein
MSLLKQFSKDTLIYGLGKGLKKFIGLLLLPVYTRALSPQDFGILDTLGSGLFFIIVFFNFGLDSAVSYFYFKPEDENERGRILFTVFILRLLVVVPALALSFFAWPIARALFGSETYGTAVLINCLLIPVSMLMSEQEMVYRLKRNAWGYNVVTIVKSLVNIVCGILLVVHYKLGVDGAQLATLISTFLVVIFSYFRFTRKQYKPQFSKPWAIKMLHFGFPLIWAGLAVWIYQLSDRFFLLHYKDALEVGYYSIGSTFSQPIGLLNMAVQMSFGVMFYEVYNNEKKKEKDESKQLMRRTLYLYLSIVSIAIVFISSLSYQIVGLITTEDYLPGIIGIPLLMVSLMFSQMVEIVPKGISIAEKTWFYTWVTLAAAVVNVGLNFIFIPRWGVLGAAFTTVLSTATYFALADLISRKYFDSEFSRAKVYVYSLLTLIVASVFPFLELYGNIRIEWPFKLIASAAFCLIPFVFGFVFPSDIRKALAIFPVKLKKG